MTKIIKRGAIMEHNARKINFYKTYYDAISKADDNSRLKLYDSVFGYFFDSIEPDDADAVLNGMFVLLKSLIEEDIAMGDD